MAKRKAKPSRIYARGNKLWCRLKDESGKWISRPTPYNVGQEAEAGRFVVAAQRAIDARREAGATDGALTIARYAERWIKDRRERRIASADDDERRLRLHVLPHVGGVRIDELRPRHVRDLVRTLRADPDMAPRTVRHAYGVLRTMMRDAVADELIAADPCVLKKGELPAKQDKDPEWRAEATYTVAEVETLISDVRIPVERRVQYALKAIAGLRHGEVAALRWRHYDHTAEPLGRLTIATSWDSRAQRIKDTKTGETRAVPVHPTLAAILTAWKADHWTRIYGRAPTADDHIVPARTMQPINVADAGHAMTDDLERLDLRRAAGQGGRSRGGHDLRSWFKTRVVEDGADSIIIRRVTHAPPKDVEAGYQRFSWAAISREVGKLQVAIRGGEALALATAFATGERKARNRWRKVVTPKGLEPLFSA